MFVNGNAGRGGGREQISADEVRLGAAAGSRWCERSSRCTS